MSNTPTPPGSGPPGHNKPGVHFHPRSPEASVENLLKLAGTIRLSGPAPSKQFIGNGEDERLDPHAGE
jgi:hypothetical protein